VSGSDLTVQDNGTLSGTIERLVMASENRGTIATFSNLSLPGSGLTDILLGRQSGDASANSAFDRFLGTELRDLSLDNQANAVALTGLFESLDALSLRGGPDRVDIQSIGIFDGLLDGGPGRDTLRIVTNRTVDVVDLDAGEIRSQGETLRFESFEIISGNAGVQQYLGSSKGDDIRAAGLNDRILTGEGDDTVTAGFGKDVVRAGPGKDSLDGGDGNDRLFGDAGVDTLIGGAGKDRLAGGTGRDLLEGDQSRDKLFGEAGRDTLEGGAGPDLLRGGTGRDALLGGLGPDILEPGPGRDRLLGGSGTDTFVLRAGDGRNTVIDFTLEEDRLRFDRDLWANEGRLSRSEVIEAFGTHGGDAFLFSFPGASVSLRGLETSDGLDQVIEFL